VDSLGTIVLVEPAIIGRCPAIMTKTAFRSGQQFTILGIFWKLFIIDIHAIGNYMNDKELRRSINFHGRDCNT